MSCTKNYACTLPYMEGHSSHVCESQAFLTTNKQRNTMSYHILRMQISLHSKHHDQLHIKFIRTPYWKRKGRTTNDNDSSYSAKKGRITYRLIYLHCLARKTPRIPTYMTLMCTVLHRGQHDYSGISDTVKVIVPAENFTVRRKHCKTKEENFTKALLYCISETYCNSSWVVGPKLKTFTVCQLCKKKQRSWVRV